MYVSEVHHEYNKLPTVKEGKGTDIRSDELSLIKNSERKKTRPCRITLSVNATIIIKHKSATLSMK